MTVEELKTAVMALSTEEKKAFICTCTPEELEKDKEEAKINKIAYRYSGRCSFVGAEELAGLKENKTPFVIRI